MKNNLLALLGFVLLSTPLAATAQQSGDFTYDSDGSVATITGYTGPGGVVTIPDTIDGLPVTAIAGGAFYASSLLFSVTIPRSVTDIGPSAFNFCPGLMSVTILSSFTSIGNDAFRECHGLRAVAMSGGVASIGSYAFAFCYSLTNVAIPGTVTNIGEGAFVDCSLTAAYFLGNAPFDTGSAFNGTSTTVYYLPGTTGWGPFFSGRPAELWNPQASSLRVTGGHFGFNITGPSNTVIVVEACTNLAQPFWLPVSTNAFNGSGASSFSDLQSANYPARFYRFRSP